MSSESILSRLDPALFLVGTRHRQRDNVLVATWIASATLVEDEGRVLVGLSPENLTAELVRASGRFAVQLLAEGQHTLIPRFGLRSGRETDKLAGFELNRTRRGLPLVPGTCGWLDCDVVAMTATEERLAVLGSVVEQAVEPARTPLKFGAAARALPRDTLRAIEEKREAEGERDRRPP